jgi:pimeloyl-ACP methyl ester carboxylesterase
VSDVIRVSDHQLDDLRSRLARVRWPDDRWDAPDQGAVVETVRAMVERWQHDYDWRATETMLNSLDWCTAEVDGQRLSGFRVRAQRPNARLLVLLHGWPSTVLEMLPMVKDLTNPDRADQEAFDLLVPSLPGFPFSERNDGRTIGYWEAATIIERFVSLVEGSRRFGVHGVDWGAAVAAALAIQQPERVIGIHVSGVLAPSDPVEHLTQQEENYLLARSSWSQREGAYFHLLATRPRTFAFGVDDSPVSLLAWLVEKHVAWGDFDDILASQIADHLLSTASLFWFTQTLGSAARIYSDSAQHLQLSPDERVNVPVGVTVFPHEVDLPPRSWAERRYNVVRWSEMPRGGHFPALEEPSLLIADLRAHFSPIPDI